MESVCQDRIDRTVLKIHSIDDLAPSVNKPGKAREGQPEVLRIDQPDYQRSERSCLALLDAELARSTQ